VLYYSIYGVTAIIGLTVTPLFFAFHMFDVLVRFPLLQSVLQSIWIPRKSLLLTFLLYQLMNYVFSLAGYYWFYDEYNGYCNSTWLCFLTATDKAFKVDGGIGGFLTPNTETDVSRFVFDNLYFLLVMIIMINIVAGIIIDNFGTLREEEKEFRFDIQNICFVCGHDRETLEKANDAQGGVGGTGFINHIRKDHYLWNYLFYIAYIQDKEKTEYTGLESYIAEQIENEEISWFPTHRALILKGTPGSEEDNGGLEPLKAIDEEQRALVKDAGRLSKNLQNLEELIRQYELKKVSSATKHPTMRTITSGGNISDRGNSGTRLLKPDTGRIISSERRRSEQKHSEGEDSDDSLMGEKSQDADKEEINKSSRIVENDLI